MSSPASRVFARSARGIEIEMCWKRITASSSNAVNVARTLTAAATLTPWSKAMRAQRWFEAKALATPSSISTPTPGDNLASMNIRPPVALLVAFLSVPLAALACDYPDEGNLPLRRAVTRVKLLPETEAWAASMHNTGAVVQYALSLDREWRRDGRCYWTVEARAEGSTWRRFYVSPDGKRVLSESGRPEARARRKATASGEARAGAR